MMLSALRGWRQWSLETGVDYDSMDGEPVKLVFLIAAPNSGRKCTPGSAQQAVHASDG